MLSLCICYSVPGMQINIDFNTQYNKNALNSTETLTGFHTNNSEIVIKSSNCMYLSDKCRLNSGKLDCLCVLVQIT